MPITRRRRANPPDQPENNNNSSAEASTSTGETPVIAQSEPPTEETTHTPLSPVTPPVEQGESISHPFSPAEMQTQPPVQSPSTSVISSTNGERPERQGPEKHGGEKPEQSTPIESGRRTARGELFRRPPQVPPQALPPTNAPATSAPPLQPPSHEISLPLGNLLHLSYNPGYTGAEEARSQLLQQLAQESKNGGRARCWNCGSLAIKYDRWNTRSKTFGEVGVAICEICGVWSVM